MAAHTAEARVETALQCCLTRFSSTHKLFATFDTRHLRKPGAFTSTAAPTKTRRPNPGRPGAMECHRDRSVRDRSHLT
jgi:hypothetical protein